MVPLFARSLVGWVVILVSLHCTACTISESMEESLPLNSVNIPNIDRLKIVDMVIEARRWPGVEIRGIVYAGGYLLEHDPQALAKKRAAMLEEYLIKLGIDERNLWITTREIKASDVDFTGNRSLNQIAVTLVPICEGGCERLCNDYRATPTSKAIKQ